MSQATHSYVMFEEDLKTRSLPPLMSMMNEDNTSKRKSPTRKLDLDLMDLSPLFHMRQDLAAAELGVAQITLKRACKRLHFTWPYRKFKAIRRMEKEARRKRKDMTDRAYMFHRMPFLLHNELQAIESCRKD
jgi:hypothetical protein